MGYNQAAKSTDLTQSFNFRVELSWPGGNTELDLPFDKITGLKEATGQIEWRASGDSGRVVRKIAGLTKTDNVTLEKVYSMDSEDIATIKKMHRAAQGKAGLTSPYFTVDITPTANLMPGDTSAVGKKISLSGCFVVSTSLSDFDVNSNDFNTFSIELSYDEMTIEGEE